MRFREMVAPGGVVCLAISAVIGCEQDVDAIGFAAAEQELLSKEIENPEVCPEAPDDAMLQADDYLPGAVCNDVPDGTLCAYNIANGWAGYVCGCHTENVWHRTGTSGPPELASPGGCPDGIPVDGTLCQEGDVPIGPCLYYPNLFVSCDSGLWQVWKLDDDDPGCSRFDVRFQ
jgi:hypothetical protein